MNMESTGGFVADVEKIAQDIRETASESENEEELREGTEYVLRSMVTEKLRIPSSPWKPPRARYEVTLISRARIDALYGHVIIEYERPRSFETRRGFEKAADQVKQYITEHARNETNLHLYFGVVLDGHRIGFVRYRDVSKGFESKGPFDVNRSTVARLVEAILGLRRKALGADDLLRDFGPGSQVARESIKSLYDKLLHATPRTEVLFEDWRRVFSQVCAYKPEKLKGLEQTYGLVEKRVDVERLLFSLHTYYAFIMKLVAGEIAALHVAPKVWSFLEALEAAYLRSHESLRDELKELEREGGIFSNFGIVNFLEADYFAWYLDEWDRELAKCMAGIIEKLSQYDPSAADLEPDRVKDLFKRLYQNLAPKTIRHDLGEYYTPDWLAELVLDEVGWTPETFERMATESGDNLKPLELRLLDPACGSGTFLVLAIGRLRAYVDEHWTDKGVALRKITKNIIGFDLNPLAVIASRTNYLIALGDLLRERGTEPVEFPVYMADSLMVGQRPTVYGTSDYTLTTVVGEFAVPVSLIRKGLWVKVLPIIEQCVEGDYTGDEFEERLLAETRLQTNEVAALLRLFKAIVKLEKQGKNGIWLRVLRNSSAPLLKGTFDYVVGNPPWVLWDNLPEDYRNSTKPLWEKYGLFTLSGTEARYGGAKKDVSVLFTYTCLDRYLKSKGLLGFLITESVFKTKGAGEGFRRFRVKTTPIRVRCAYDLVETRPFEGANNRTAAVFLEKGEETSYPVPYVRWVPKRALGQTDSLDQVRRNVEITRMVANPSDAQNPLSPWSSLPEKTSLAIRRVRGRSEYEAHAGIYSGGANAVYWVNIVESEGRIDRDIEVPSHLREYFGQKIDGVQLVHIENVTEGMKKQVESASKTIEDFFIYPMLKSRHVKKWRIDGYVYSLQVQDPVKRVGYDERWMKTSFPRSYSYLKSFERLLLNRVAYKKYVNAKSAPFYTMYNVGKYTYAPYKVVWNRMGSRLLSCVISEVNDKFLGRKMVLPENVLAFMPTTDLDEAHYLCALLNSSPIDLILRSIAGGTKSFGSPKMIQDTILIPRYDKNNKTHSILASLSKRAHELAPQEADHELAKVERRIDEIVAILYGLTDSELSQIKMTLKRGT